MSKFHINSKGEAAPCKATKRACKFGKRDHFTSLAEATRESEKRLAYEAGGTLKSYRKETQVKEAIDPISRVTNIDNLLKSKSHLEKFGESVRFKKNVTIEDVETTAYNAAHHLRNSFQWSPSIKVTTKDPNQHVTLLYNRAEDLFEVKETDAVSFNSRELFSSKLPEVSMLYIADHYRYDD